MTFIGVNYQRNFKFMMRRIAVLRYYDGVILRYGFEPVKLMLFQFS